MRKLDVRILDERIRGQLPAHATPGSAGLDIRACIDEAITLGKRIGVMRAGPRSQVKGVVEVALNGARSRTDDVFLQYYKQVYEMIRDEVAKAIARTE